MMLEKLQLIATAKVSATFKGRWCRWWNLSKGCRQEYNFPVSLASNLVLRGWIDKVAFFARVFSFFDFFIVIFGILRILLFFLLFEINVIARGGKREAFG